jgi:hypothetical protein
LGLLKAQNSEQAALDADDEALAVTFPERAINS